MSDANDFMPVGAVVALAGTLPESGDWLPCDGRTLTVEGHRELYDVLRQTYGGTGGNFNLPDYRGFFLRGRDASAGVDPDAGTRQSLNPAIGGGDRVGTRQEWGTGTPVNAFTGNAAHLPSTKWTTHGGTTTHFASPGSATDMPTCTTGGDRETRPVNVYVNYYIKTRPPAPV